MTALRTLLIVDDSILVLGGLARSLRREFTVTAVTGAAEAMRMFASGHRFDAILCDENLDDGIGGSGLHFYLMRVAPDQAKRFVLMSGALDARVIRTCRWLDKPASKHAILSMLESVIDDRDAA